MMTEEGNRIVNHTYTLFVQSLDTHYSEIVKFLAIVFPSFTGFFYALYQYSSANGNKSIPVLFIVTLAIIGIFTWATIYALAMSYRSRYLQASLSNIERETGINKFLPKFFKPTLITSKTDKLLFSIAPEILRVHIFFFISSIILIGTAAFFVIPFKGAEGFKIGCLIITALALAIIVLIGACYYIKKYNKMIGEFNREDNAQATQAKE